MEVILQQINMVPGVIGCFMCSANGQPLARSLPAAFDSAFLKRSAVILAEIADGLQKQTDGHRLVDVDYDIGRFIVKQIPEGFLAIVCKETTNAQLLAIYLNVAQNKISNLKRDRQSGPALAPNPDLQLRKDNKGVILTVDSMNVSAKIKWNQMEESIAISNELALEIQRMFNIAPFKKVKLVNRAAGCSKTISLITFKRDNEQLSDDKIVLTLAAAEALKAKPGDEITAEPVSGGGFFS